MQRISFVREFFRRCFRRRPALAPLAALLLPAMAATAKAAEKIPVFPDTPYDGFIIHESLVIFWIAILGILVIIRMKIKEIERTQEMGADREDSNAPLLE